MVVRNCDQFLLKGCLLLKETEFLLSGFDWDGNASIAFSLSRGFFYLNTQASCPPFNVHPFNDVWSLKV